MHLILYQQKIICICFNCKIRFKNISQIFCGKDAQKLFSCWHCFFCNWSIARELLILVIYLYYWLKFDISTERGYLKKCWYRIRPLTYVRDDTIKLVTVEIYYCCSTMRFTIKTNYYLYSLLKIEWGLRKDVFSITDLIRATDQRSAWVQDLKHFPWIPGLCCVSPGMTMERECGLQ